MEKTCILDVQEHEETGYFVIYLLINTDKLEFRPQSINAQRLKGNCRLFFGFLYKAKRHLLIKGNSTTLVQFYFKLLYQVSKTIIKGVWVRIARKEMDCNLKKLG